MGFGLVHESAHDSTRSPQGLLILQSLQDRLGQVRKVTFQRKMLHTWREASVDVSYNLGKSISKVYARDIVL